jgi:succinate dehydrogenase / fumarate reductase cytochrome b subunit
MQKLLQVASITKKITLAIIGLFLITFLLVHLGINLCLLRNDGGEWFRAAAHFMGTNYIIKVFEIVLFAAIGLHILLALFIQYHNWRARPIGYKSCSKSKTSFGSKLMIWTGLLVAFFIGIHLVNFWFAKVFGDVEPDFYEMVFLLFQHGWIVVMYVCFMIVLCFHLMHAFPSAFQTLGLAHSKYTPIIKIVGIFLALVISVGFAIIPLFIYFFK